MSTFYFTPSRLTFIFFFRFTSCRTYHTINIKFVSFIHIYVCYRVPTVLPPLTSQHPRHPCRQCFHITVVLYKPPTIQEATTPYSASPFLLHLSVGEEKGVRNLFITIQCTTIRWEGKGELNKTYRKNSLNLGGKNSQGIVN